MLRNNKNNTISYTHMYIAHSLLLSSLPADISVSYTLTRTLPPSLAFSLPLSHLLTLSISWSHTHSCRWRWDTLKYCSVPRETLCLSLCVFLHRNSRGWPLLFPRLSVYHTLLQVHQMTETLCHLTLCRLLPVNSAHHKLNSSPTDYTHKVESYQQHQGRDGQWST